MMTEDTIYVDASGRRFAGYIGSDGAFHAVEPVFNPAGIIAPNPLVHDHAYRMRSIQLDVSNPGTWPAGTRMLDSNGTLWSSTADGSVPDQHWHSEGPAPQGTVTQGPAYHFLDDVGVDHADGTLVTPPFQVISDLGPVRYTPPPPPTDWTPWFIGGGVATAVLLAVFAASRRKRLALGA